MFAFILAPIGLILSIVGIIDSGKPSKKGKGLAVAGVIVSIFASIILGAIAYAANRAVNEVSDVITEQAGPETRSEVFDEILELAEAQGDSFRILQLEGAQLDLNSYFEDNETYPSSAGIVTGLSTQENDPIWLEGRATADNLFGYTALPAGCTDSCTDFEISVWQIATESIEVRSAADHDMLLQDL